MNQFRHDMTLVTHDGPHGWTQQYKDLSDGKEFDWKSFLVGQGLQIVRSGVTAFGVGFIKHTSDPNQKGQNRFDFLTFYVDGSVARLHPNKNPGKSAEVLYGHMREWSIMGQDALPPGLWHPPGPESPKVLLTMEHAHSRNTLHDKIGISEVKAFMKSCSEQHDRAHPTSRLEDLSFGTQFQWWRWICNTGRQVPEIIGPGITSFFFDHMDQQFEAYRTDGSCVRITPTKPVTVTKVWPASSG
jgi:hypothetical protein